MKSNQKTEYLISIDLHGTLLDKDENLSQDSEKILVSLLLSKPSCVKIYICTGNDLGFLERKLSKKLLDLFDGVVLETGVIISLDKKNKEVLVTSSVVKEIKAIQESLIDNDYSEIYKFADRMASISMFMKHEESVFDFYKKIKKKMSNIEDKFRVTYSSVAVDIIPVGFNKFTGIKEIQRKLTGKRNYKIIAIADSINDYELLRDSDISFLPFNCNKKVISGLEEHKMRSIDLQSTKDVLANENCFYISNKKTTFGVIEILEKIFKALLIRNQCRLPSNKMIKI